MLTSSDASSSYNGEQASCEGYRKQFSALPNADILLIEIAGHLRMIEMESEQNQTASFVSRTSR